jgi:hypothetical protein
MPNLRIVWDNAADRGQIAASSEAQANAASGGGGSGQGGVSLGSVSGPLPVANLRSNLQSKVWRATTGKASIVCQWDIYEPVGCVVLAFNNMTAQAKVRVRGYTQPDNLYPEFDTGFVTPSPGPSLGQFQWGSPLGDNFYARGGGSLFAYGYGSYHTVWIPEGRAVKKLEIAIDDTDNPDTFIEIGRLIVGPYWTPKHNFDFGHSLEFTDTSKGGRTEAGDLRHERGPKFRRIDMSLSNMLAEDRAALMRLIRLKGATEPVFLSMFPENDDVLLEQSYQLWGKFADGGGRIMNPRYDVYSTSLSFEEM